MCLFCSLVNLKFFAFHSKVLMMFLEAVRAKEN